MVKVAVIESRIERFAVRREDAPAGILARAERHAEGKRRVGVVHLAQGGKRGDVVQRVPGHEARTVRRHGENGRLAGDRAAAQDRARGDLIDEHVSGRSGGAEQSDDVLAVGSAKEFAVEFRIRSRKRLRCSEAREWTGAGGVTTAVSCVAGGWVWS